MAASQTLTLGAKVAPLKVYLSRGGDFNTSLTFTDEDDVVVDISALTIRLTVNGTDYTATIASNVATFYLPWDGVMDNWTEKRFPATLWMEEAGLPTIWAKGEAVFQ